MIRHAVVAIVAVAFVSFLVRAQEPKPFEASRTKTATATIQAINQSDRHIVLLGTDGSRMLLEAGADVRNFDKVRPGDRVVVTYHEGVIAEVKPKGKGAGAESPKVTAAGGRTGPGEMPAKAAGASIATTVTIESVDSSFDTVTFKPADGVVRTLAVESPEGKEFIEQLKPGDEVQITYREAAAVSIEPARG
jgi:hypothetical protein